MPIDPAGSHANLADHLVSPTSSTESSGIDIPELLAVILLSVTAVLTAWTGFQASKWNGAMSISFNQASAARIDASRQEGTANRMEAVQVALFTQWLQASANGDQHLMDYLSTRFPEPLRSAFLAWKATDPSANSHAPPSPFAMPQYQLPGFAAATAGDDRANAEFSAALVANQRGDNYTLLTVAFASVLFFTAMSGRMKSRRNQWTLLGLAIGIFAVTTIILVLFPKRI